MVPNEWREGRVRDLIKSLNAGVSVNSEDDGNLNSSYKILKTSCVSKGVFDPNETKSVVEDVEISRLKEPVLCDSIIISRMNTPALVGANGYIENGIENTYLPDRLWQAKPKSNDVNMKWLGYWFASSHTRYTLSSTATGTSGSMKNITKSDVLNIKIDIPPLPEQRKIAQILSTWDKAISTTERLIDNSKQQKKALMQQLLTGKKRLIHSENDGFSVREGFAKAKLGELPNDWNVCLLSEFYWYQEGPGVRKHQFTTSGVKLFNGTNIQNSRINLFNTETHVSSEETEGPYSHFLADAGDLVIACSGISVDKFDEKIAFIKKEHLPLCMNTSTMRFKVKEDADACLTFLQYFMMSPLFKNQIRRQITGSAQLNFGPSHVGKCFIAMPSLAEQKKISALLSLADSEIDLLEQQLADLKQEKKALMQQLLTGRRRVKVDDKEVA